MKKQNNKLKRQKFRNLWPLLYSVFLVSYTAFTLLDTFVLPRDMVPMAQLISWDGGNAPGGGITQNSGMSESPFLSDTASGEPIVTENSYCSENIAVTIQTSTVYSGEYFHTEVYVADIILRDASHLHTAVAGGVFGRNVSETTSEIAAANNAVLAINGDYYGFRDTGFVMREGGLYRDVPQPGNTYEDLVIYEDGSLEIVNESQVSAQELADAGALQIFSFGPGLIKEYEIAVEKDSEVEHALQNNPRTAFGEIEPLHYVMVVADGRTQESTGLTLYELAEIMHDLGCRTAYNMDGGGSSTMWFMGRVVNRPYNEWEFKERSVSDIVYIGE